MFQESEMAICKVGLELFPVPSSNFGSMSWYQQWLVLVSVKTEPGLTGWESTALATEPGLSLNTATAKR